MQFELTEEQLMIRQAARDFANNECLPGVIERDEKQKFPYEQAMKLAELGFMGMMISPDNGGRAGCNQLCAGNGRNKQS
jgi:alkylation response protein AidB-like acyl-CoA dehydrogenase